MSAPNFRSNAGTVFTLPELTREDILYNLHSIAEDNELPKADDEYTDEELAAEAEFMTINLQEDCESIIVEQLSEDKTLVTERCNRFDNDRNYGGHIFLDVSLAKNHSDVLYVDLELMTRGGYYGGANFDYNLGIYNINTGETLDVDDIDTAYIAEEIEYYTGRKTSAAQANATYKALLTEIDKIRKAVEKVLTDNTTPLIRVATFSNGEAVYQKRDLTPADLRG